jgi:hypothetical protein
VVIRKIIRAIQLVEDLQLSGVLYLRLWREEFNFGIFVKQ